MAVDPATWLCRRNSLQDMDVADVVWHLVSLCISTYNLLPPNPLTLFFGTPPDRTGANHYWWLAIDSLSLIWAPFHFLLPSSMHSSRPALRMALMFDRAYHRIYNTITFVRALHLLNIAIYEFEWGQWSTSWHLLVESLGLFGRALYHKIVSMGRQLQTHLLDLSAETEQ